MTVDKMRKKHLKKQNVPSSFELLGALPGYGGSPLFGLRESDAEGGCGGMDGCMQVDE